LIFKNPNNKNDKNIYGLIPIHALSKYANIKSDTFVLVGNDVVKPNSQILLSAIYLYPNNFLLDSAMFIIVNTEKILNTFLENYLNIEFNTEREIPLDSIDILSVYKGKGSSTTVTIQDKNYIIGSNEDKLFFTELPEPGLILLDKIAKKGYSGSPIVSVGKIYGFISRASGKFDKDESNHNNCLAINSYYLVPWLFNTCNSVYQYIGHSRERVLSLLTKCGSDSIRDNITPSVLTFGCSTIHYPYGNNSNRDRLGALIYLVNEFLDTDYYYRATDRQSTNSISYKTLMNSCSGFINEFNSNVINCTYFITKITYVDRLTKNQTIIDYVEKS